MVSLKTQINMAEKQTRITKNSNSLTVEELKQIQKAR